MKKLGELLVDSGLVTAEQVKEALADQNSFGGRIGTVLYEKCLLDKQQYLLSLSSQLGIPALDYTLFSIPDGLINVIPKEMAWDLRVLPSTIKQSLGKKALVLGMADPFDVEAIKKVESLIGYSVEPALALESEIRFILEDYYGSRYARGEYRLGRDANVSACADGESSIFVTTGREDHAVDAPALMTRPDPELGDDDRIENVSEAEVVLEPISNCEEEILELEQRLTSENSNYSVLLRALVKSLVTKGVISSDEYMGALKEVRGS